MARAALHENGHFLEPRSKGDGMAILAPEMLIGYVFLFEDLAGERGNSLRPFAQPHGGAGRQGGLEEVSSAWWSWHDFGPHLERVVQAPAPTAHQRSF